MQETEIISSPTTEYVNESLASTQSVNFQGTSISINEIYQIGVAHKSHPGESSEVYLLDFVDSLHVSYPVNLSYVSTEILENLPPFFHGALTDETLSCIASNVLKKISVKLDCWMDSLDANAEAEFIARHLAAHDELTVLRQQTFNLLKQLLKNEYFGDNFDPASADLDRLLLRIIDTFSTKSDKYAHTRAKITQLPLVSLCPEPNHCVDILRQRILMLIHLFLPQLKLPNHFNSSRDLADLINLIYSYNIKAL